MIERWGLDVDRSTEFGESKGGSHHSPTLHQRDHAVDALGQRERPNVVDAE